MSTEFAGLIIFLAATALILVLEALHRKNARTNFRVIPTFERLQYAVHSSIENGMGTHVTMGRGSILSAQAGSALAAMEMLTGLVKLCVNSDTPPLVTSGDSVVHLFSSEIVRDPGIASRHLANLKGNPVQLTGITPYSYIAGAMVAQRYAKYGLISTLGSVGPETGLLIDSAERMQLNTAGGTDNLLGQAVLFAMNSSTLLGEEYFAASAYLQKSQPDAASLKARDILRLVLVAAIIIGAILKVAGE